MSGPLTCDTDEQAKFWEGRAQNSRLNTNKFHEDQLKLYLQKNEEGLYKCRGRIQGSYPIYLPPDALLTEKIVCDKRVLGVHGGVGLRMSFIRQQFWVPRLRQLTKRIMGAISSHFFKPISWKIANRTEGSAPFEVVGLDFAGPMGYKLKPKKEGKTIYFVICLQFNQSCPPWVAAKPNSWGVHQASQTVHREKRLLQEDLSG